jgi:hypothetical protein
MLSVSFCLVLCVCLSANHVICLYYIINLLCLLVCLLSCACLLVWRLSSDCLLTACYHWSAGYPVPVCGSACNPVTCSQVYLLSWLCLLVCLLCLSAVAVYWPANYPLPVCLSAYYHVPVCCLSAGFLCLSVCPPAITWDDAWRYVTSGIYYKSRGHFRLPECEQLPSLEGGNFTCTRTGITDMRWDLATSELLAGHISCCS